jgi:hypothetical protein
VKESEPSEAKGFSGFGFEGSESSDLAVKIPGIFGTVLEGFNGSALNLKPEKEAVDVSARASLSPVGTELVVVKLGRANGFGFCFGETLGNCFVIGSILTGSVLMIGAAIGSLFSVTGAIVFLSIGADVIGFLESASFKANRLIKVISGNSGTSSVRLMAEIKDSIKDSSKVESLGFGDSKECLLI